MNYVDLTTILNDTCGKNLSDLPFAVSNQTVKHLFLYYLLCKLSLRLHGSFYGETMS